MIKFDAFVKAIHDAILSANDKLADKNLELLNHFFEVQSDGDEKIQDTFDKAVTAINAVLQQEHITGKQKLNTVLESLQEVKDAVREDYSKENKNYKCPVVLRPKMTTIQYPHKTANGVVMSDVHIPLITLVPLSMTQISEVKISTNLDIQVEKEELLVSFPSQQAETQNNKAVSSTRLEITLTPHHGTEGLKKIVEGYEKVLRAQIPN